MAGIQGDGSFKIKGLEEILADIDRDIREGLDGAPGLGDDVRLDSASVLGQVRAAPAVQLATLWAALGELSDELDPRNARGAILDGLVALSNVRPRLGPTRSRGVVTITGAPRALIPAGARIRGAASGVLVETVTPTQIPSAGVITVNVRALEVGPLEAPAGDLTQIVTPYAGWTSATNPSALIPGRFIESDDELRTRRELSLFARGIGTDGGIRASMLAIPEVQQALVISNRTHVDFPNGQEAHSARVVLWPDTGDPEVELEIARALEAQLPSGSALWGQDASVTILNSQGRPEVIAWDYADEVSVYVSATLAVTADAPADIAAQVQAAITAYFTQPALRMGQDVAQLRLQAVIAAVSPEIESATVLLGTSDPPLSAGDITIAEDAIARLAAPAQVIVSP